MHNDSRTRVILMGAAGRDFHNFNVVFRNDPLVRVVAFTATQIPDIAGRTYPPSLSGPLYPSGIPIVDESELCALIKREYVDWVYFCYSAISHADVMHKASTVLAAGASFRISRPGPHRHHLPQAGHQRLRREDRGGQELGLPPHRAVLPGPWPAGQRHPPPHALR